jgi:DNA-binding transcriptional LysR family regulator
MVVGRTLEGKMLNAETIYIDGLVETIKRRVLKGSGFAWMPQTAVAEELADGRLVRIGDETWTTRLTIAALANPASFDSVAQEVWDKL